MKSLFSTLTLIALGLAVMPVARAQSAAAPASPNVPAPMLTDKAGKVIGRLVPSSPGSYGSVIININNEALVVGLQYDLDRNGVLASNGLSWQPAGALIYSTTDCTGQPYVGFANLGSRRPAAVLQQDSKWIAHVGQAEPPQQISAHSYLKPDGACVAANAERRAVPVSFVLQLETLGSPPFYIR